MKRTPFQGAGQEARMEETAALDSFLPCARLDKRLTDNMTWPSEPGLLKGRLGNGGRTTTQKGYL
eukprot:6174726-Pleurochrysis_carterae.AAC.2